MSAEDDFAAFRRVAGEEIAKLREEIAELRAHAERVGEANDRLVVENAALRAAAVEVCALARVWVTVWGDKLSAESIKRLGELEKQILKKGQP